MKPTTVPRSKKSVVLCDPQMVHTKRCVHLHCLRPFRMMRLVGHTSGLSAAGRLVCPHCGLPQPNLPDSVYVARALSTAEEAEFDAWLPASDHRH